ncbi:hypothetical protein GJ700_16860 [Duganella sp. FT92W]|uniref:Uncharacterized protein n=1 Tax=Pseudoduganella rivuli TaxID=2666085 RepID=A0A7X2IP00_9BURK|nr:hypothetical protein [Pseudoduganella rivuli]MRV73384.1 hypothetical protein [Pseudoduganella rivuli]
MLHVNRTIYMPTDLLQAFSKHTGLSWSSIEIEGAVCDAMAEAMKPRSEQAPAPQAAMVGGYQWKQLFLPVGTMLRASFGRDPYYAVVDGNEIKYGEFSLSPSAFANLQGSGNRNAWKAVWLRFPGFRDWVRADECRAMRQAATARMFEPSEPFEPSDPDPQPAHNAGDYQREYTENKPSGSDAVPLSNFSGPGTHGA